MSERGTEYDTLARADALCQILATAPNETLVTEAAALLKPLRDMREFGRLCEVAELVRRHRADDATAWRLHAQGLIETRRLTLAVALLNEAKQQFGPACKEADELDGLLGRAYKQLLMDTPDPGGGLAPGFLERAIDAYAGPYARNRIDNYWHGVNLAALASAAARHGLLLQKSVSDYLGEVRAGLESVAKRDCWWHATKAEMHAALGEWRDAEEALFAYLEDAETKAFNVGSTLRQWRDVWRLQDGPSPLGARLIQMLEARLMRWPEPGGVTLKLDANHLVRMRELEPENDDHLQRVVGPAGFDTLKWYRTGLMRAASVAAVSELNGLRFGTGFAVRAADLGITPAHEILLLTNHHVLNSGGFGSGGALDAVEIVFEAANDAPVTLGVKAVVAESPVQGGLDYALLSLAGDTGRVEPLPITRSIPRVDSHARVYLIGYPLGDMMQFSMHDNVLLDHECEPTGRPTNPARRLLQYSASTEKGNSGSPVFDPHWRCIGLHHAGGKRNPRLEQFGLPALNGANRTVDANQGIWIGSIQDHVGALGLKLGGA